MKQFLSIVLRNEFNLFYRFGYSVIPKINLIEYNGNVTYDIKENIIKQFATLTPFEYDEEYLILLLEKNITGTDNFVQFEIQDLIAIYPLSQHAKTSIESKIDQRIRLEKPIFEAILSEIESEIEKKDIEKAFSALWTICNIDKPLEKYTAELGLDNIFQGLEHRKTGVRANKIKNGNYWEYLIAYDRFDYFPNTILGYFYDAGQVFAFSKGHSTFEGSGIHGFLENINSSNSSIKLPDIIRFLETEKQIQGYVYQTTAGGIKQYIVAPLYLMLRDEIRKSDDITQTKLFKNLSYLKTFDDSFNYVVILLAAFFGFRKFYDQYYEALNLRFFKCVKAKEKEIFTENQQEQYSIVLKDDKVSKSLVLDEKSEEQKIKTTINETGAEERSKKTFDKRNIQKNKSDNISIQYSLIIENAFNEKSEIKLTDIAALIKEKTKQKVTNNVIKNIIKEMDRVEIIPKKKPETARRKEKSVTLFSE